MTPSLPLDEVDADVAHTGRTPDGRLHPAADVAARRAEGRAEDRRARADGRCAAAGRKVPRVLGRRHGRPDSSRPGRHDVRVQAGCGREVQQDHRPRRRPVPRPAGRVDSDRPAARQVHGRHPGAESRPRADLAARAARIRDLSPLGLEALAGARQDDSRRALRRRHGGDAAPADRRLHRHRQVGRPQRDADQHPLPRHAGRCAADHDRPEAPRAGDVRGHPASADAGRRRSEAGQQRAALGGPRDGRALQDARRGRRPEHRAIQPQHPARDRRAGRQGRAPKSPSRCRSSWS